MVWNINTVGSSGIFFRISTGGMYILPFATEYMLKNSKKDMMLVTGRNDCYMQQLFLQVSRVTSTFFYRKTSSLPEPQFS